MHPKLEYNKCYHIYSRANGRENLFVAEADYTRFLNLYEKYIETIADTYAFCLMKNHFHLLVKIKDKDDIGYYKTLNTDKPDDPARFQTTTCLNNTEALSKAQRPNPVKHFAHLLNAYTKYFNARYQRHGNLFERPFKRKLIENQAYFRRVVVYIHTNPVHHLFCDDPIDYPWSTYKSIVSVKPTKVNRHAVLGVFDDLGTFKQLHQSKQDLSDIANWSGNV